MTTKEAPKKPPQKPPTVMSPVMAAIIKTVVHGGCYQVKDGVAVKQESKHG